MKLFLIMSDSHGDFQCIKKIINQFPSIQTIIHLGDYYRDSLLIKESYPDKEFFIVPGNCDAVKPGIPYDIVLKSEEKRLLLTHGHRYEVKSGLGKLKNKAALDNIDIVLFGHTHIPLIEKSSTCLLVNPGSAGYPRYDGPSSYALLEIGNGRAEARIMEVT